MQTILKRKHDNQKELGPTTALNIRMHICLDTRLDM